MSLASKVLSPQSGGKTSQYPWPEDDFWILSNWH
jgi:DNA polymerase II small subunit/DNA polymerase delta subunit B